MWTQRHVNIHEQAQYAQWREEKGLRRLQFVSAAHAGVLFLDYGKDKEGYFDAAKLKIQLEEVLDLHRWGYNANDVPDPC